MPADGLPEGAFFAGAFFADALAGDALTLFGGLNCQFMIEEINRGARGMMPGSDLTAEFVEIWDALERRDQDGAWNVFTGILPLVRFELQPGLGVSAMKHNLARRGIIRDARVRHPTAALDPVSTAELEVLDHRVRRRAGEVAPTA